MRPFHLQSIQQKMSTTVYLVQGVAEAKPVWCYVEVPCLKLPIFLKEATRESLTPAQYGEVLFSGKGEAPPEQVRGLIAHRYGNQ